MKVSVQDFFQQFYDSQLFYPNIVEQEMKWAYFDIVFDAAVAQDSNFKTVDKDRYRQEMMSLKIETIGLVFCHNNRNDKLKIAQSIFTKDYLERNNQMNIWEIMLHYNKVIAQSGYEIVSGEKMKRGWDTFLNTYKIELLKKWESKGMDSECAIRVLNRYGTEVAWSRGISGTALLAKLVERLEYNENYKQAAVLVLTSAILGFYQDAKDAIKKQKFI